MQLSSEQITEKLVELVRPHVFTDDVKSDKHRDAQRLQNVWESICMEMGVDDMDGKQGLREGGSGGTSYPGPGLGGPGLKGPGSVQVSALSFGITP